MRVTCESCGAQYNLPDEKVRGRRAKVRCKKCSASIVVDGTVAASEDDAGGDDHGFEDDDEATQVMQSPLSALSDAGAGDAGGEVDPDSWTVNLSDDDQRQLTTDEIVKGWLSGDVPQDAFLWQDGMSDWLGVLEVPRIADRIKAQEAKAAPAPIAAPTPALGSAPKAATPNPPFATLSKKEPSNPAATRQARPATFDLFGPPRSLQRDSTPHAAQEPKHPPVGASNENSVLFSLDALKAAAGQQSSSRPPESRVSEDILTMGGLDTLGSPLSAPLIEVIPTAPAVMAPAAQVAAPVTQTAPQAPEKKTPVWVWGAGAAAILLAGFFGGRMMMAPEPTPEVRTATTTESTADPAAAAAEEEEAKKKAEEEEAKKKAEEEEAKKKAEEEEAKKKAEEEAKKAQAGSGSGHSGSGTSSGSSGSGSGSSGSGSSGSESSGSKSGSSSGGSSAPGPFNVGAAKSALSAAAGKAKLCKKPDGPTGSGKVQVTFAPSGRVTSANVVSGPFGGTSVGGCVARAFRSARVPAFSGSSTTVAKSFSIK